MSVTRITILRIGKKKNNSLQMNSRIMFRLSVYIENGTRNILELMDGTWMVTPFHIN